MKLHLSDENVQTARDVGVRRAEAMKKKNQRNWGADRAPADYDRYITGAVGELGVGKAFNLFWDDGVGDYDAPDVGDFLYVKTKTFGTSEQRLNARREPDDAPCVLVHRVGSNDLILIGWMYAREVRSFGVWDERKKYWYVEPTDPRLRPMSELFAVVAAEMWRRCEAREREEANRERAVS